MKNVFTSVVINATLARIKADFGKGNDCNLSPTISVSDLGEYTTKIHKGNFFWKMLYEFPTNTIKYQNKDNENTQQKYGNYMLQSPIWCVYHANIQNIKSMWVHANWIERKWPYIKDDNKLSKTHGLIFCTQKYQYENNKTYEPYPNLNVKYN